MRPFILFMISLALSAAQAFEGLPNSPPIPADNPMTAKKIELGKKLFFDPRISKNGAISCNSCHNIMAGGDDNRDKSVGVGGKLGGRSSPTVWNSAYQSVQFWDGRAATLEDQAKGPMINAVEMGMSNHDLVVKRIGSIDGYQAEFKSVFGGTNPVTVENVTKAIAAFERTLITPNSPFDRYFKGDKKAITQPAIRGSVLFSSIGCVTCHSGPNFSGPTLPPGQGFYQKFPLIPGSSYEKKYLITQDMGRFEVTKNESDKNTWRVPTLRNIALTAPYFHNGSVKTLDEAVRVMAKTQLNRELKESEVTDIVAFLKSLTGEFPELKLPRLPETSGQTLIED